MSEEPGWITKADAAVLLGVDERTIERRARAGRIQAKARPGFPTRYWQADVEKLRQTSPGEVRTGLLEAVTAVPSNGNGKVATVRTPSPATEAFFVELLQALRGALAHGPTGATGPTAGATGPTDPPAYMTLAEALARSGLSRAEFQLAVAAGEVKVRGRRYRRKDVEAL